jgi:hypothetical protein
MRRRYLIGRRALARPAARCLPGSWQRSGCLKEELFSYSAVFEEPPPALVECFSRLRKTLNEQRTVLDRAETSVGLQRAEPMADRILTLPPIKLPLQMHVAAEEQETVRVVPVAPEEAEDFAFDGVAVARVVGQSAGDVAWEGQHVYFDPDPVPLSSLTTNELVIICDREGQCFFKRKTKTGWASVGSRKSWKYPLDEEARYYRTRGVIWRTGRR